MLDSVFTYLVHYFCKKISKFQDFSISSHQVREKKVLQWWWERGGAT